MRENENTDYFRFSSLILIRSIKNLFIITVCETLFSQKDTTSSSKILNFAGARLGNPVTRVLRRLPMPSLSGALTEVTDFNVSYKKVVLNQFVDKIRAAMNVSPMKR